jgi:hypothetical protein
MGAGLQFANSLAIDFRQKFSRTSNALFSGKLLLQLVGTPLAKGICPG